MEVHDDLLKAAMAGDLTEDMFNAMMRKRRDYGPYLRTLYTRMVQTGHPVLAANVCAHVLHDSDDKFFAKKLKELIDQGHAPSTPVKMPAA